MAEKDSKASQRLVLHTAGSRMDMASIYLRNEIAYGETHAERFMDFLDDAIEQLAQTPSHANLIEGYDEVRIHLVKSSRRRQAYGYRVFFRQVGVGIEIIRILHTSMDWRSQLP